MKGISYPLEIENGNLRVVSDSDLEACHIRAFLETEIGERLGLILFGTPDYTFTGYQDFLVVGVDIQKRLTEQFPNSSFEVRSSINDDGTGVLEIFWSYLNVEQESIVAEFGVI